MNTLTNQLLFSRRILDQMRQRNARPEDIAAQAAVVATVERAKFLEDVSREMDRDGVQVEVVPQIGGGV